MSARSQRHNIWVVSFEIDTILLMKLPYGPIHWHANCSASGDADCGPDQALALMDFAGMTEKRCHDERNSRPADISRRKALARLGLMAGIAYAAPVVLHLDRSANARVLPTPCPRPHVDARDVVVQACPHVIVAPAP